MATDLPLRCGCANVQGMAHGVTPEIGNRLTCYCDDCQAFAWFLGAQESALDAHGGTDIFQLSPARIAIEAGREHLACVRLTPKGIFRWYAACCRTPLCNTPGPGVPLVGLIHTWIDTLADRREEVLGPTRWRVQAQHAVGNGSTLPADAHDRFPPGVIFRFGSLILRGRLAGDQKRSPFFDPATREPIVTPQILSADERREVETARSAANA